MSHSNEGLPPDPNPGPDPDSGRPYPQAPDPREIQEPDRTTLRELWRLVAGQTIGSAIHLGVPSDEGVVDTAIRFLNWPGTQYIGASIAANLTPYGQGAVDPEDRLVGALIERGSDGVHGEKNPLRSPRYRLSEDENGWPQIRRLPDERLDFLEPEVRELEDDLHWSTVYQRELDEIVGFLKALEPAAPERIPDAILEPAARQHLYYVMDTYGLPFDAEYRMIRLAQLYAAADLRSVVTEQDMVAAGVAVLAEYAAAQAEEQTEWDLRLRRQRDARRAEASNTPPSRQLQNRGWLRSLLDRLRDGSS